MSRSLHQRLGRLWISLKCSNNFGQRRLLCHRSSFGIGVQFPVQSSIGVNCDKANFRCYSEIGKGAARFSSQSDKQHQEQDDRIKLFIDPQVQTLLKELTGRDLKRVFRKRKIGQKIREPKYTFMTEEELQKARQESEEKADTLLQMPPVLRPRQPIDKVIEFDPCLQGDERATLIFTDITMNVSNRDRVILARDPDGTFRRANWDERDKMNSIYFPVPGRGYTIPKMFTDLSVLQNVLNRASEVDNTYEFVLDRACFELEPDNPLYIASAEATYETVDQRGHYDFLKSTRHYGPLVFYLVRMRKLDGILLHSLKNERMFDAVRLVYLFHIMFPKCKSRVDDANVNETEVMRRYIQLDAIRKGELELAFNAYLEEIDNTAELEAGLKRQHGIQNT